MMQTYTLEIDLAGELETVLIKVSETGEEYTIYHKANRLGVIYREMEDDTFVWKTKDLIASEVVRQIGEKIEIIDI